MRLLATTLATALLLVGCATGKSPSEPAPAKAKAAAEPAAAPSQAAPSQAAPAQAVEEAAPAPQPAAIRATVTTNLGDIELELWPDKAPKTVETIVKLMRDGFYEGILFHRVVPGFVIQVGDPLTKDPDEKARWGSGGPGFRFEDEPVQGEYERGALAMANAGPNTNGSQFFVCLSNLSGRLPKKYNLFGKVIAGMEVVDRIAALPRDARDCPTAEARILKVSIKDSPSS